MEDDNNTASKLIANDEIKEILNRLEKIGFYAIVPKELAYMTTNITLQECKTILDYITNLQQENQELNDSITWWNNRFNAVQRDYEDYKSRIEKAVEYIKQMEHSEWITFGRKILLEILNGRSDE